MNKNGTNTLEKKYKLAQSYNSLIEYDYRYILNFYTQIISTKINALLASDITFALELYCKGSIYQTIE